ncbi:MAG: amino acid adenylation domain-containing protein, partial [Burkholderiales bacterium]|nr:amino acid adenylation domain-containing protein [Burkholderiales bacterium]
VHSALGDPATDEQPPLVARGSAITEAPLSYSQEALWFLDRLVGPNGTYNIALSARLAGAIRAETLERALQALVERHDTLRTAFDDRDGEPLQRVVQDATITLPLESLEAIGSEAREDELARRMREQALVAFDLSRAPLIRAHLYRLAPDDHALLIVVHHIVSDGWSSALIAQELGALYRAFEHGEQPVLPELPLRFGDFAAWQRSIGEAPLQRSLARWLGRLAGLESLELPTDLPRPPQPSGYGDTVDFTVPPEQERALRTLARKHNATLYMVLLAAFQTLLMRYSGQTDFAVVVPTGGRLGAGSETSTGHFVNALVMRADLSGDPAFTDLVGRVREHTLDDYAHEVPFDVLVRHLNPERQLDRNPVYQVAFVLQNLPDYDLSIGEAPAWLESVDNGTARFDLALEMIESGEGIRGHLTYSTDLFERATIERMAQHLCNLIGAIVENPQARLSTLPMMGRDELDRLLVQFNDTARPYPLHKTLHQLFEEQVARTPQAIAVVFEHQRLDYASLNAQANRLAHHLRSLGVRPGVLVGLCVERSLSMIVGLLATLKAGGTYVPLDPAFPAQRLAFMLEDSQASVLLTQTSLAGLLPVDAVRVVNLDRLPADVPPDAQDLPPMAQPDDLAYVLYTSGSTGKPKGVEIPHRALTNFLWSMRAEPGCDEHDIVLALTTLSFDIAGLELFLPLITGARVELVSRETATDGQLLRERIEQARPTLVQATPATWRMLIDAGWAGDQALTALIGGEPLPPELVQPLLERTKALWNLYGPTETTIWSSAKRVTSATGQITVGRPIANTTFHIVDEALQPVPIGVAGELLIGGDGLARGYRNRPELTVEKFIGHPFSDEPGARLYRTGDLARYRSDGEVVHLGRMDHQVKIRGFRIELGEIEAALTRSPDVAQAVVMARHDLAGGASLVAYLVPAAGRSVSATQLRQTLRDTLPDYMVPQHFVVLASLPLL